jgi:hypothetical protein
MDKFAKCISAFVVTFATAFYEAQNAHLSAGRSILLALVGGLATGVVTWGVPNKVATEVKEIATDAGAIVTGSVFSPGAAPVDSPTTILPRVKG